MPTLLAVLLLFALAPQPSPQYGWAKDDEVQFELQPGEVRNFTIDIVGRARVTLKTDAAPATLAITATPKTQEEAPQLQPRCVIVRALKGQAQCELATDTQLVWVVDSRPPKGTMQASWDRAKASLGAVLALKVGGSALAEKSANVIAPNRVTLKSFKWQCIANCP